MPLITLVCGASGVGKSYVATALAARDGVPVGQADDIVTALTVMTSSEQHPMLHFWADHPEAWTWPAEKIADLHIQVANYLSPAFAAVIDDHVQSGTPVLLEGDYLLPELALPYDHGVVRAVVLDEPDERQLLKNFRGREPGHGDQHRRAEVSALVGTRLVECARQAGIPVVPARPWASQLSRIDHALTG
jgi:2-phosphoglycerate kinase